MWAAEKFDKGFSNGQVYVRVVFYSETEKFETTYTARTIEEDWPDGAIRARLEDLNVPVKIDIDSIELGPPLDAPVGKPIDPTPEELARLQWLSDYFDFRTQAALKDLPPDLAAAYKPEYGRLL